MNGPSIARRVGEILAWITIIGVCIYSVITLVDIFSGKTQTTPELLSETPAGFIDPVLNTELTTTAVVSGTGAIQIIIPTTAPNLPSNPRAPARATAAAANPSSMTETPYIVPVPTENITQTITMEPLTPTGFLTVTLTGTPATATVVATVNGSVTATKTATPVSTATVGSPSATVATTATSIPATATKTRTAVPATATSVPATATEAPTDTEEPTETDVPVETPTP
ncbi:MAG: hypothetical protein RLY87_2217 [Chloroflexota bacterium]